MNHNASYLALGAALLILSGCSSLKLDGVEFGWTVESVLTVNSSNSIEEVRYGFVCNVAKLASEEFNDSTALQGAQLHLLRSSEGYYFLTGPRFKCVYVFAPGPHELTLKSRLEVSQKGLLDPALNQRAPYVELLDGDSFKVMLTSNDIAEGKKQ